MLSKRIAGSLLCFVMAVLSPGVLIASEHRGQVLFGGLPVPGATVTATNGDKTLTAVTDLQGAYVFPNLADGVWKFKVEMLGFAAVQEDVAVSANAPAARWDLHMQSLDDLKPVTVSASTTPAPTAAPTQAAPTPATQAAATPAPAAPANKKGGKGKAPPAPTNTQTAFQRAEVNATGNEASAAPPADSSGNQNTSELSQRASDGFLINGTTNNAASSPFALAQAFGNNRRGAPSLYNGNIGIQFDNSALDARPFSLTGQDTPRPAYNRFTGVAAFGGPLKIPHLIRNGPNIFLNYQWTRNRTDGAPTMLVPTEAERGGDFFGVLNPLGQPVTVIDPTTGTPFAGNVVPATRFSPQALALLNLYPLPNFAGSNIYNYQIPTVGITHQDSLQARINRPINRKNQIFSNFAFQDTRAGNPNIFGFLDTTDTLGINTNVYWRHQFSPRFFANFGVQYSRQSVRVVPNFANHENVAGDAGITGDNQQPVNWGPPTLNFASGLGDLTDGQSSFTRNQTSAVSFDGLWNHGRHNVSFGADFRRQDFNLLAQQDPRGTFTFTGTAAGFDFADFLLGIPDTSSIAFGNADKYFRASSYDAYVTDDWRVSPSFTLNAGVRWEYWAPITEQYGRLVNLDIASSFSAQAPVVASNPVGPLTGQNYPSSLVQPDHHAFQPRVGFSWRPLPASSMVVRGGYGVYYNTSVYLPIATQMAQESPLSKSLNVANTPANPLTLANGFVGSPSFTPDTFAVDPNFRVGYAQNWYTSVQRDLPGSMVMTVMYQGSKGTRGQQEFLPNTYPAGAVNPCPTCPSGFVYLTSNGNSSREAGQFQLRRRLHNGFTTSLQYTYAKAIDDAALGGRNQGQTVTAQNWLDLAAERGRSNFDQRHQLVVQTQYTTGMGIGGGTLVSGWKGALFKEWTFLSSLTAGTGFPLTPVYFLPVQGTGVSGPIRPEYTGAPLYSAAGGLFLNPAAYEAPLPGQWGNAGRNTITGPAQFSWNASLGRTFRMSDRLSLDLRVDSTNTLNHVTYPNWNTTVNSAQFGLPNSANAMRSLVTNLRLRF